MLKKLCLAAAAVTIITAPAYGQGFLKNLARAAAERAASAVANKAVTEATKGATNTNPATAASTAPAASAAHGKYNFKSEAEALKVLSSADGPCEPITAGSWNGRQTIDEQKAEQKRILPPRCFAAPAPVNFQKALYGPFALEFSPETIAEKQAFNNAAAGSFRPTDPHLKESRMLGEKVAALGFGESLSFRANSNHGTVTVIGEQAVGNWPCKQVRWVIYRGPRSAGRLGLFCKGPESRNGNTAWVEAW